MFVKVPGMENWGASPIFYNASEDFMFEMNFPEGLEVQVVSDTEVIASKILYQES